MFDHTSFIRFLDTWLSAKGKQEENSPVFPAFSSWRQAISGDLTSTFDFNRQSTSEFDALIDPSQAIRIFTEDEKNTARDQGSWWGGQGLYPSIDTVNLDPEINSPTAKKQDVARCDILPIGYDFQVFANFATVEGVKKLNLTFRNCGKLGVAFYVYSYEGTQVKPRVYSVEGGEGQAPLYLADALDADGDKGAYRYVVHGPNGYLSEFRGMSSSGTQAALADVVDVQSIADGQAVRFLFGKWPTANGKLKMVDAYSSAEADVNVGGRSIDVPTRDGWYDVSFVDGVNDSTYLRRYAGHLENGKISRSDPAIGLIYDDVKRIYQPAAMS